MFRTLNRFPRPLWAGGKEGGVSRRQARKDSGCADATAVAFGTEADA